METKTGFVSIDKPHLKNFRNEPIRIFEREQTIYDLVMNSNQENMDYLAIEYFGNTMTYGDLSKRVDQVAKAYVEAGVKSGDVVALAMINTPEVAINFLALNKIGAVSKWLDVRASAVDIEHYLNEHECKLMVSLDLVAPKVGSIIEHTDVNKVLTISPSDSLGTVQSIGYKLKNMINGQKSCAVNDKRFVKFGDFVKSANSDIIVPKASFEMEKPSVIVQSSGTTGIAKSIVHRDYGFTSFADKLSYTDIPFAPKKSLLVIIPPFVAYGLCDSLYLSLAFGMKAQMYPKFDPDAVVKNMGKFNFSFAAPFHYRYLADNKDKIKKEHLEMMETLISGGDKITVEELNELKGILNQEIINGWGNNEGLGAVAFNPYKANKFGSIGVPKYGDTVIAVDQDTYEELKYNEIGELCFNSETAFMEYAGDKEKTDNVIKIHKDGKKWIHTGDLGSIDEEGYITHLGRIQRVIVRQGFKLSPQQIESAANAHPAIKECFAVGVPDEIDETVPMLFYTLKDEFLDKADEVEKTLIELCNEKLKENLIPKYYKALDEMPYTPNNKYDFKQLEALGKEYVDNKIGYQKTLRK